MTPSDPRGPQPPKSRSDTPAAFTRTAWASMALALIALALGTVCLLGGHWGPGLIFVFAAMAGIMTAWQLRRPMGPLNPDR